MKYISIDGDDVGRRITSCYLKNDEKKLEIISKELETSTIKIARLLTSRDFSIIFRAADGVVASTKSDCDIIDLFTEISRCSTNGITFSAGVGSNLREAYVALLSSKSNGKNQLSYFSEFK